jgi:hypothetical protein
MLARQLARDMLHAHRASFDAELLTLALDTFESGQKYVAYQLLRAAPRALAATRCAHSQSAIRARFARTCQSSEVTNKLTTGLKTGARRP